MQRRCRKSVAFPLIASVALVLGGCHVPEALRLGPRGPWEASETTFVTGGPELRRLAAPPEDGLEGELGSAAGRAARSIQLASFAGNPPPLPPEMEPRSAELPTEEAPLPTPERPEGTELTLEEAIQQTLAGNPDLASASAQLAMADAALARARAEFYPKFGLSEDYGVTDNPVYAFMYQLNQGELSLTQDFNHPPITDNFQTQLRAEHRVYAGHQRLHEEHVAAAQLSAAAQDLRAVQNQLVYRIAEAYYRLLQARDLVEVRQEAVSQVEQHLEIVQSRYRNDTAVKSDVLTVQVRLAEVREAFITAQNRLQLAWAVLQNVSGAPLVERPLPATIPPAPWNESVEQIQLAVGEALAGRPEIGASASQQQAASEGVLVAQAGKRLAVDLVADYDVFTGDFRNGNDSFFAGVMFHLNLCDGGRAAADVGRALAKLRDVQARHRRLLLDIELDVRRAHLQLNDAQARLQVADQTIGQARESLREIEVRYRGQTATISELVDAQVALSNAGVRRTNAQADVEISRAALQRAMGRLSDLL